MFYVDQQLKKLMFDELCNPCRPAAVGGFLHCLKQIANVGAFPQIVGTCWQSTRGRDTDLRLEPWQLLTTTILTVVSLGGVGFDINCEVSLLRTNLLAKDVLPVKEQLEKSLFLPYFGGRGMQGNYFDNSKGS